MEGEEGADEALPVQEFLAADEVRLLRTLTLRRMESQPRRRQLEERRKAQARRRRHVEQVPAVDLVPGVDVEPHHPLLQAPAAPPRVVVSPTGLATARSPRAC